MYQFVLVLNPFMLSGNKRLNILKQIFSFFTFWYHPAWRSTLQNWPLKKVYNDHDEKKLNFQTHNDLQASHIIAIFAVFKKWSLKRN